MLIPKSHSSYLLLFNYNFIRGVQNFSKSQTYSHFPSHLFKLPFMQTDASVVQPQTCPSTLLLSLTMTFIWRQCSWGRRPCGKVTQRSSETCWSLETKVLLPSYHSGIQPCHKRGIATDVPNRRKLQERVELNRKDKAHLM